MAHSDGDQRHRPRSTKPCPESRNGGCNYCISGEYKRPARRKDRRQAKAEIRRSEE